jgi:glycosyltransferase involved in cell wall biosynthesis
MTSLPLVTALIPVRNEEQDIERCLRAVLAQDHPHDRMEIVLVDGGSTDGTAAIAAQVLRAGDIKWTIVDHLEGTTPSNLNAGLAVASGEVVCRVDGRSIVPNEYFRTCAEILGNDEIVVVGGRQVAQPREGADLVARSIVRGLNNRWATGLARYRRRGRSAPADTVYLGAMRADDLRRVGGWDERFDTNQDFDLNRRLAGYGVVWFDDRLSVGYLPRETFGALWKQYVRFGRWKARYWRIRRERPQPRQYVLLAGPVVAAAVALALALRHPRATAACAIAGAVVLDVTGVDEPASPAARLGGIVASTIAMTGWWFGVVTGWMRV